MSSGEAGTDCGHLLQQGQAISCRNRKLCGSRDGLGQASTQIVAKPIGFSWSSSEGFLKQR